MSTTSIAHLLPPSAPQPSQAQRLLKPTTQPIPLLTSQAARVYSHVHTVLVLVWMWLRFPTLVVEPLETMMWDLGALATLQGIWCVVCLPAAGTWAGSSGGPIVQGTGTGKSGSMRRRAAGVGKGGASSFGGGGGGTWMTRVMPTFFSLILAFTLPPLPLTVLALVLGAPLYPYALLPHTLLLSLHVSLLAFLPIFYTHGVVAAAWRDVLAAWLPFDEAGVWGGTIGCLVGGWVGAVPMALDWDREWQKWPVTVLVGCYLGWGAGRAITDGLRLGVGRRINLSEVENVNAMAARNQDGEKKTS